MELLELFVSFVKIGFSGFGGHTMLPLISSEMLTHAWMTSEEISDLVIVAEVTPGPVGSNCATFAGYRVAGLLGAVTANIGILIPTLTLTFAAAIFFEKFKNNKWIRWALTGIRPACVGLIAVTVITLGLANYIAGGTVEWMCLLIAAAAMFGLYRLKLSIPAVMLISAVFGLIFF